MFNKAAMWAGRMGKTTVSGKASMGGMKFNTTRNLSDREILSRGRKRLAYGGGAAAGTLYLGGGRNKNPRSSGTGGLQPRSSGGMTMY